MKASDKATPVAIHKAPFGALLGGENTDASGYATRNARERASALADVTYFGVGFVGICPNVLVERRAAFARPLRM